KGDVFGRTVMLDIAGSIRMDDMLSSPGRMHLYGPELCYLLHKNGVIVSSAWGGSGDLQIDGTFTMRRHVINLGTTDGSLASAHEVVGGIGFMGLGQSHGQLSYRTLDGFELINCSKDAPRVGYGPNDYPYTNLTLNSAIFPQPSGSQRVSLYFEP